MQSGRPKAASRLKDGDAGTCVQSRATLVVTETDGSTACVDAGACGHSRPLQAGTALTAWAVATGFSFEGISG